MSKEHYYNMMNISLPGTVCLAVVSNGAAVSDAELAGLMLVCLLIIANAILALVNILLLRKGIQLFNIIATTLLALGSAALFTKEVKAAAIGLFVMLIHILLIYVSYRRRRDRQAGA